MSIRNYYKIFFISTYINMNKSGTRQKAESEDPKVQARREKARIAYAKRKTESLLASSLPVKLMSIVAENEKKNKAKETISRAVQAGKAREEMRKLKYEKKKKELQAEAIKYLESNDINMKGELIIPIKINYWDFKTYISQQYPEYWEIIRDMENRIGGKKPKDKYGNIIIEIKYRPYRSYDYFIYEPKYGDGSIIKRYGMKINHSVDEEYSNYLSNKYYRIPYTMYERSKGIFNTDVFTKDIKEMYRVPDYDYGKPPPPVGSNELVMKKNDDIFSKI